MTAPPEIYAETGERLAEQSRLGSDAEDAGLMARSRREPGAQLRSCRAGNTLQATPVIANGILYIGTRSGGAEAFAAKQAATRECPRPKACHLCMLTISS
jgi:hypothetical protein